MFKKWDERYQHKELKQGKAEQWWIDDEGKWRFVDANSPHTHLSNPINGDSQSESIAFRALGFVRVSQAETRLTLQWDVRCVAIEALQSTIMTLERFENIPAITLKFYLGGWREESFDSRAEALKRITRTIDFRQITYLPRSTVKLQPWKRTDTMDPMLAQALPVIDKIKHTPLTRIRFLLQQHKLLDYCLIFERGLGERDFYYDHVGYRSNLVRTFGTEACKDLIGQPVWQDANNPGGGNPFSSAYNQVIDSGEPRFDHILGNFKAPGQDRIWVNYQRLLFSWSDDEERFLLGSLCVTVPSCDIPFL